MSLHEKVENGVLSEDEDRSEDSGLVEISDKRKILPCGWGQRPVKGASESPH